MTDSKPIPEEIVFENEVFVVCKHLQQAESLTLYQKHPSGEIITSGKINIIPQILGVISFSTPNNENCYKIEVINDHHIVFRFA